MGFSFEKRGNSYSAENRFMSQIKLNSFYCFIWLKWLYSIECGAIHCNKLCSFTRLDYIIYRTYRLWIQLSQWRSNTSVVHYHWHCQLTVYRLVFQLLSWEFSAFIFIKSIISSNQNPFQDNSCPNISNLIVTFNKSY